MVLALGAMLIPAHIDGATGYRCYSEEQLPIANRIQALKSMGLGLSNIKDILTLQAAQKQEEIVQSALL